MTRGGKRSGAGRPPKLDDIQRIWVGQFCENEWQRAIQNKVDYTIRTDPALEDYQVLIAKQRKIKPHLRPEYLKSEMFDQHKHDVEAELRTASGWDMEGDISAPRLREYIIAKPQGIRAAIIAEAKLQLQQKFQVSGISNDTIRKCWDEWRAFEKATNLDG